MKTSLLIAISLLGMSMAGVAQTAKPLSKASASLAVTAAQEPKLGGVAGGGGNFTTPLFWQIVRETIIPQLKELKTKKADIEKTEKEKLTTAQIDRLLSYMNPQVTKVSLSPDPLFLKKDGKKVPVDAINYPSLKAIELYVLPWQSMVKSGMDITHLIFHEFMGLAQISDKAQISIALFPARKRPISFTDNYIRCAADPKFITINEPGWLIRDGEGESVSSTLSNPKSLNPNPECIKADKQTGECIQRAGDYKVKTARLTMPLNFDGIAAEGDYSVEADINLISDYYGRGWGAAANTFFLRRPQLNVTWKLIMKQNGQPRVLSIITQELNETDEYSTNTSSYADIPVPAFIELIEKNGYPLSLEPYSGELTSPFRSYNIAGFLINTAMRAGAETRELQDQFVIHNILKGSLSNVIPFRISTSCTLSDTQQ